MSIVLDVQNGVLAGTYERDRTLANITPSSERPAAEASRWVQHSAEDLGALRAQRLFQEADREVAGTAWMDSGRVVTSRTGTILEPRNFHREWPALRDSVPGLPKVTFHGLRHSLVSLLLAMGTPPRTVMEIAGHAGLAITMNTYGHVRMDGLRDALDRLGTLFSEADNEG